MVDNLPTNGPQQWMRSDASKNASQIARALMTMRLEVKAENISADDLDLQTESFTRRLIAYPVEHVLAVIHRWPDDNRFWPSWNDLKVQMDERMAATESARLLAVPGQKYAAIARDCQCWTCKLQRERAYGGEIV